MIQHMIVMMNAMKVAMKNTHHQARNTHQETNSKSFPAVLTAWSTVLVVSYPRLMQLLSN